jgi:ribosome-associated heat shock protein Hsp15
LAVSFSVVSTTEMTELDPNASAHVRLDKWLWAARFFKTRSLAATAINGGKVHVNGVRPKPARSLHVGDRLEIRRGPYEWEVVVRGLEKRRGPATEATLLYEETEQSAQRRQETANQLRIEPARDRDSKGRPTKKRRRAMMRFTLDEI